MDFNTFQKIAQNSNPEEGIIARFYDKAVKTDKVSSDGLPVFQNKCFVEIRIRDNNSEVFDQPATPEKIKRFPVEYARYQLGRKQVEKGTPLEQFAFLTAAEVETLKIRGIFTVEALSELSDDKCDLLKIKTERDLALKFLSASRNNQSIVSWQKKEETYLAEINALKEALAELKKNSVPKKSRRK